MARGTCDRKIEVIECQFPLCISLLCGGGGGELFVIRVLLPTDLKCSGV